MKVGILTQPIHWNYGGIIQNWALQQVLRRMGHEPVKLERSYYNPWPQAIRLPYDLAKATVAKMIGRPRYLHRMVDDVERQIRRLPVGALGMNISHKLYDRDALVEAARNVDTFIVGSDQVWREDYSPDIEDFFLGFLDDSDKRPRIAYAASFGKKKKYISAEKMPECRRLLSLFDAVSVRENEGIDIVKRDFGREQVEKVLDPTLLLTATDYQDIIRKAKIKPHIASYILDCNAEKELLLNDICNMLQCTVDRLCVRYESTEGRSPKIQEWLRSISTADFVVTDSFHGCVFSIIFNKPFIAIANVNRGLDRFISLLGELDLTNRLVYSYSDFEAQREELMVPIDYSEVNKRLDALRAHSLEWLKSALEK